MPGGKKLLVLVGCDLLLETVHNVRIVTGSEDVPHLGLAVLHAAALCQCVVGMHLDGEAVHGINELDKQGEFGAEAVEVLLANQFAHVNLKKFVDMVLGQEAILHDRLVPLHARERPEFATVGQRVVVEAEGFNPIASPYFLFVKREEFQRVQKRIHSIVLFDAINDSKHSFAIPKACAWQSVPTPRSAGHVLPQDPWGRPE